MGASVEIVLIGCCVSAGCALLGTFLVLRKVAMLGDAISHAVLPGIVIAFLLTGDRSTWPMLIGAGALGLVTVFLVSVINRTGRVHEDASIGVVFPVLFSVGVILVAQYAGQVDLDIDCVLHGEIAYAPLDRLQFGDLDLGPRALWVSGGLLLANILLVGALFKELKITSFDPQLAAALGFAPLMMHYVLMGAVSVTVVGAFESVGAILVVAMLIVPPATAYLLTNHLSRMLFLGVGFGVSASIVGYFFARWLDCSIAGAIASAAGAQFVGAIAFAPGHGLLARLVARKKLAARLRQQLVLLHLDPDGRQRDATELTDRFQWTFSEVQRTLRVLADRGLVCVSNDRVAITAEGIRWIDAAGTTPLVHEWPQAPKPSDRIA